MLENGLSLIGTQILVCFLHLRTPFSCIGVNCQESNETGSCALSSLCLAVDKKVQKKKNGEAISKVQLLSLHY